MSTVFIYVNPPGIKLFFFFPKSSSSLTQKALYITLSDLKLLLVEATYIQCSSFAFESVQYGKWVKFLQA